MNHVAAILILLVASATARADEFHTLVGYDCVPKSGKLVVYYRGAYNEAGELMMLGMRYNELTPDSLLGPMVDDDHIGEERTITVTCKLKKRSYTIEIGPSPGNGNIQGRCGAFLTAWVEIRRQGKVIFPRRTFESSDCHVPDPVLTRVELLVDGEKIKTSEVAWEDFYK